MYVSKHDNSVNSMRNNFACKTKTKQFRYVCFSVKKRDFAIDDNMRFELV